MVGQGSFGKITRAMDTVLDRCVVLKKQPMESEAAQRELMAYKVFAAHPSAHVLSLYDYFTEHKMGEGHRLVIVYELCDCSLHHIFKSPPCRGNGLAPPKFAAYIKGTCSGLAHLHGLGIVHGDFSLKNLLVKGTACVVADPGAAHSAQDFSLRPDEEVTTAYIRAPERLLGEARSSAAIDLWACGVVAWCMATGECAWYMNDGLDVLLAYNTLLGRASPGE